MAQLHPILDVIKVGNDTLIKIADNTYISSSGNSLIHPQCMQATHVRYTIKGANILTFSLYKEGQLIGDWFGYMIEITDSQLSTQLLENI